MTVRILEDGVYFKRGLIKVSTEVALELISKGMAVRVTETTTDKEAHDSLNHAKARDQQQDFNAR